MLLHMLRGQLHRHSYDKANACIMCLLRPQLKPRCTMQWCLTHHSCLASSDDDHTLAHHHRTILELPRMQLQPLERLMALVKMVKQGSALTLAPGS
jgi:hypothetical protein